MCAAAAVQAEDKPRPHDTAAAGSVGDADDDIIKQNEGRRPGDPGYLCVCPSKPEDDAGVMAAAPAAPAAPAAAVVSVERLIALPDLHGDAAKLRALLARAEVAAFYNDTVATGFEEDPEDPDGSRGGVQVVRARWQPADPALSLTGVDGVDGRVPETAARATTVVFLGDLVDRGAEDAAVLNLALDLRESAEEHAGRGRNATAEGPRDGVVLLLGNHELLNLQGQFHYVHRGGDYSQFGHPRARAAAFAADGVFGRALREHFKTMHAQAATLFVHAGLERPASADALPSVDAVNAAVAEAVAARRFSAPVLGTRGPLWTRTLAHDAAAGRCGWIAAALRHYGVRRIVVGHTPQRSGRPAVACGGAVVLLDAGVSRWMFDGFAALEIAVVSFADGRRHTRTRLLLPGGATVTVPPQDGDIPPPPPPPPLSAPPPAARCRCPSGETDGEEEGRRRAGDDDALADL